MPQQTLPIQSPIKGVVRAISREQQSPDTLWSATNILPYDRYGRRRLSQRGGLTKQFSAQLGSATFIQNMIEAPNIIYPPNPTTVPGITIADIGIPFPLTTPGTSGPYTVPNQGSYSISYGWVLNFQITGSLTVNWTDGVGAGDGNWTSGGNCIVTVDVGAAGGEYYFIVIGYTASLASENFFPLLQKVNLTVYYGTAINTWTLIGTVQVNGPTPLLGDDTCQYSVGAFVEFTQTQITINGTGYSTPLTATIFPNITFGQATVNAGTGSNATQTAISVNMTD